MSDPILVDRDRAILRVWGREPVKMIHGLATADIEAVGPDRGVYTAFLTAKGKMVADARVFPWPGRGTDDGALLVALDRDAAGPLADHIARFVPPLFARQEDRSAGWSVIGVYGDGATATVAAVSDGATAATGAEETVVALDAVAGDGAFAARTGEAGGDGWELYVPVDRAEPVRSALIQAGAEPADAAELERRRVAAGRPAWGAELTPDVIPLEADLLDRAISQTKGCYTGQEVIVRILHRGHVNRHLRRLEFDDDVPAPGTELYEAGGDRVRGVVTSSAAGERGARGLGYVRREIEPPAQLHVGAPDGPTVRVLALD